MNEWIGKTLGKVRIESLLARGGIAEIYLGTHTTLQRKVAVKILRNQYEDDPDLLERFQREARVVAQLRHPNIVQVFDYDAVENRPYLVMEFIEGPSLARYLSSLHERNKRMELAQVNRLLTATAGAIQYAHQSGVIHRDIKPGNILLTSRSGQVILGKPLPMDFEPVLTDFGLVRFLNSSSQTSTGFIAGTPAYMSPEQARGEHTDERTDIYSLGIVLYEILAGRVPFEGETTMSVILKHVNDPPEPIKGLPASLQYVLDGALEKDPDDRFQTVEDFASAFNAAIDERAEASTFAYHKEKPTTLKARHPVKPQKTRPKWIPALLAGTATLALSAFLFFMGTLPFKMASTATSEPATVTSTQLLPLPLGPTGVLRFKDGFAKVDEVTLTAQAMPASPAGSHYEAWLIGEEERLSLGILSLDKNGKGALTFEDNQKRNLLALYDKVEITVEPDSDPSPDPSGQIAFAFTLSPGGLIHLRHLLVSFPNAPNEIALIQGLDTDSRLIDQAAREMSDAYERGDHTAVTQYAEAILNILVGNQSPDYKDWNSDGQTTDPDDGYGLLLNGDNLGYIQAVYSHADYAANSPDATQNMITNGEYVKTCAQNLAQWAPQLRKLVMTVLNSDSSADTKQQIRDAVALADRMLNGIDANGNKTVEPILGEGGALTAYEYAYYMADMPLLPVVPFGSPSPVATSSSLTPALSVTPASTIAPTKSESNGSSVTSAPSNNAKPTKKSNSNPPPQSKPTRKPKKP